MYDSNKLVLVDSSVLPTSLFIFLTGPVHSVEYTTLVNSTDMMEIAFKEDRDVTHFLHRNGLITQGTYDSVSDPRSTTLNPMDKASLLVCDIKDKVRLNPGNYRVLIQHLSENERQYKDILKILNKNYANALTQ